MNFIGVFSHFAKFQNFQSTMIVPSRKQNSEGNGSTNISLRQSLARSISSGNFGEELATLKIQLNEVQQPRKDSLDSILSPRDTKPDITPGLLRKRKTMAIPTRFIDIVPSETLESLSSKEIRRQEVIFEIMNTEKQYVRDLNLLIEVIFSHNKLYYRNNKYFNQNFLKPLQEKQIITQEEITSIFSNIEIIHEINKNLLTAFDERKKENIIIEQIGDIFNEHVRLSLLDSAFH